MQSTGGRLLVFFHYPIFGFRFFRSFDFFLKNICHDNFKVNFKVKSVVNFRLRLCFD